MVKQAIRTQKDVSPGFVDQLTSMPGAEALRECIQCGTCSGTCPVAIYMDYTPRRLIAMAREGLKKDVLSSFTVWLCSSCYACTVRCPQKIKITDIMYAFKRLALQEGFYPNKFPTSVLAKEFFSEAKKNGRVSDIAVAVKLVLKTNPFKAFGMMGLGMNLMKTGRFHLFSPKIKATKELQTIIDALEEA
jgi:heterodisulfide reductase subunit C